MVASSRRAARVTNKTRLVIYHGHDKVDLASAELLVVDQDPNAANDSARHQAVGASGVENGEYQEHHLQAALSSHALVHSQPATKPSSPSPDTRQTLLKPDQTSHATLNYHIPTPDATGLVQNADYAKLYQIRVYHEPIHYIKFSDTVEESSGGWGGLGYCMDDEDVKWLTAFNVRGEGSSGEAGTIQSPQKEGSHESSSGRPVRHKDKGKEREKDSPVVVNISEDLFEYVMGLMGKWTEENVPMLHTNLSLMPHFNALEHLFSQPIDPSFLPSFETPRDLPETKLLLRVARSIYPHWKQRREKRRGKTIFPILNFDESNDSDPYVCFRRRDTRPKRARKSDNHAVEQFQQLQYELRSAHDIAKGVHQREILKSMMISAEFGEWRAQWNLFEVKRRWPVLGMTPREVEDIVGRSSTSFTSASSTMSVFPGAALQMQQQNLPPSIRRNRGLEKEKEERDRRERMAEAARQEQKGLAPNRNHAPEVYKQKFAEMQEQLESLLARKKEADSHWDDQTSNSYQPLPRSRGSIAFRPVIALDPLYARAQEKDDDSLPIQPFSLRLRVDRYGVTCLDRRSALYSNMGSKASVSPSETPDWFTLDASLEPQLSGRRRPRTVDEDEDDLDDEIDRGAKSRRLNERLRYDASRGGALGIGLGVEGTSDQVLLDDFEPKYMRHRTGLITEEDIATLQTDRTLLESAIEILETPVELPPSPILNQPALSQQLIAQQIQQQQMLQQQRQIELQHQYLLAQQAMALHQQQSSAAANQQQQGTVQQQVLQAQGNQPHTANGSPAVNGQPMQVSNGPPQNGRPPSKRLPSQNGSMGPLSQSPTNSMHPSQLTNGQSPQLTNGVIIPGKTLLGPNGQPLDPATQQRYLMVARAQALAQAQGQTGHILSNGISSEHAAQAAQQASSQLDMAKITQMAQAQGFSSVQDFIETKKRAKALETAQRQQQLQLLQQQQMQHQNSQNGSAANNGNNANGASNPAAATSGYSPVVSNLQLKLPSHAQSRLTQQAQRTQ